MKMSHGFSSGCAGILLILALAVLFAGCTQPATTQSTAITTTPTATQGLKAPIQATVAPLNTASLPYGVTITYPNNWERQDVLTTGVRDYGRNTVNIANFYSPNMIPGDTSSYDSLSIDVDPNVQEEFDNYFNQATLAVGKTYNPQMEAHSYTLKISGYTSYQLDFETKDVKGTYIFTKVDGSMYIFAFKGPAKQVVSQALSGEIVDMYNSIQLNPPVPSVVKQR